MLLSRRRFIAHTVQEERRALSLSLSLRAIKIEQLSNSRAITKKYLYISLKKKKIVNKQTNAYKTIQIIRLAVNAMLIAVTVNLSFLSSNYARQIANAFTR